jgi:HD-like signal output (HDOD) protein
MALDPLASFMARIERDLVDDTLNFPTALEASRRIKNLAENPDTDLETLALAVQAEPVLSARLIRMANAAALNPSGMPITAVSEAIRRLGFSSIRCLAFSVAAEQMAQTHLHPTLSALAKKLWQHTISGAAWSRVLSRHLRRGNPETAMLVGILANLGGFLLLSRAEESPALVASPPLLAKAVMALSERMESRVLAAFEMPSDIVEALPPPGELCPFWPPSNISELVQIGLELATPQNPFIELVRPEPPEPLLDPVTLEERAAVIESLAEDQKSLLRALGA